MNIYVATKFEEAARARDVMTELEAAGHSIAYDWTQNEQISSLSASLDREGVMQADALVMIVEKDLPYAGSWVEFGIACARNIPVTLLGPFGKNCIFTHLPNVGRVFSLDHLLDAIDSFH